MRKEQFFMGEWDKTGIGSRLRERISANIGDVHGVAVFVARQGVEDGVAEGCC